MSRSRMQSEIAKRRPNPILATAAVGSTAPLLNAAPSTPRLGVGMHSYGMQWNLARERKADARFHDALTFLEYCHSIGAGGVQVAIGVQDQDYTRRLRERAETLGAYIEGQTSLPREEGDVPRFEAEVRAAKDSGATVMRTAMLSGRRYETFDSAQAFRDFAERSWKSITLAEPVTKRHGVRLAIENHKDWLVEEFVAMLRRLGSEHVGACVDVGNNLALLEDPLEVVTTLAPLAVSTHIKDMGVADNDEGFLLSEVPLGEGCLDLRTMIATLRRANPKLQFNLEMITRDPLKIPCLTSKYWATFGDAPASRLARTLGFVRTRAAKQPLPRTTDSSEAQKLQAEDDNVRSSLTYARSELGL
ncbi:MAG: sugar phosphate isomerase/epimerase [Verrucomicrobia bacterium]|nr:sugar phosphate isomerase/epimerase [Verrucomicrobiota bacterium]